MWRNSDSSRNWPTSHTLSPLLGRAQPPCRGKLISAACIHYIILSVTTHSSWPRVTVTNYSISFFTLLWTRSLNSNMWSSTSLPAWRGNSTVFWQRCWFWSLLLHTEDQSSVKSTRPWSMKSRVGIPRTLNQIFSCLWLHLEIMSMKVMTRIKVRTIQLPPKANLTNYLQCKSNTHPVCVLHSITTDPVIHTP